MADAKRLAGVLALEIDGTAYTVVGEVTYVLSQMSRETLIGVNGVHGYKEMPVAGSIKARLRDSGSFSAAMFGGLTSSTVTVKAANGKTISGVGMWNNAVVEVDPIEGTFEVEFQGNAVKEGKAS